MLDWFLQFIQIGFCMQHLEYSLAFANLQTFLFNLFHLLIKNMNKSVPKLLRQVLGLLQKIITIFWYLTIQNLNDKIKSGWNEMSTTFANLHISYNSSKAEGRVVNNWSLMLIMSSTFILAAATALSIFQPAMYLGISWCCRLIFCLQARQVVGHGSWLLIDLKGGPKKMYSFKIC